MIMKTSLTRRILAATSLAIGFGLAWGALAGWIGSSALDAWSGREGRRVEYLEVASDGTPYIREIPLDNLSNVTYRNLDGSARTVDDRKRQTQPISLYGAREPGGFWSSPGWWGRIWAFANEREPAAVWYLMTDGGSPASGWFVGYERVSNRRIGYIGLAGFREQPVPPEERFPLDANAGYAGASSSFHMGINTNGSRTPPRIDPQDVPPRLIYVASGNLVRVVDLAEGTTSTAFEAPAPIASVGVPTLSTYYGYEPPKEPIILVRAGGKVYSLDRASKVVGVVPLPAEIGARDIVTWHAIGDGRAVVTTNIAPPDDEDAPRDVTNTRVYQLAADGTIQNFVDVALRNGAGPQNESAAIAILGIAMPSPAPMLAAQALIAAPNRPEGYAGRLAKQLRRAAPALAAVVLLSLGLAAAAWKRSAAFGLSRREQIAWTALTAVFGVPAFVGILLHRAWPAREPCPHCRANVPRDRIACEACGTPFPAPAPRGTEIFA
jgi:hypothetical protein